MTTDSDNPNPCPKCGQAMWAMGACKFCERDAEDAVEYRAGLHRKECEVLGKEAATLFTWDKWRVEPENARATEICKTWDRTQNIYIFGPTGTGKTHLSCAMARKYIDNGWVERINVPDFSRVVRKAMMRNEDDKIISELIDCQVLMLDDLGAFKDSEFTVDLLYSVINGRKEGMKKGIIITANLDLEHLSDKLGDDRIPSRIAETFKFASLVGCKDQRL